MALSGHLYPKSAISHVIDKTRFFEVFLEIDEPLPGLKTHRHPADKTDARFSLSPKHVPS